MATVFTKIIEGELPGTFVWRDDVCVAFLSINPLAFGHTLVVPIEECDHWLGLSAEVRAHLFEVVGTIGEAQQAAFSPERVGVIIAGYEVPHTHIHVIPTNSMDDFNFANAQAVVEPEALERAGRLLREAIDM